MGIRRLLADGTFLACFPLHEGRYDRPHSSGVTFDRRVRKSKSFYHPPTCKQQQSNHIDNEYTYTTSGFSRLISQCDFSLLLTHILASIFDVGPSELLVQKATVMFDSEIFR